MTQISTNLPDRLAQRRSELKMSVSVLASRSGVSEATIQRILGGRLAEASFANVSAIAEALGMLIDLDAMGVESVLRQQARAKAERVARMVQGTSGLEGQAVDQDQYQRLVEKSFHELMAGPRRRLWSA